jgi:hypothetical protein
MWVPVQHRIREDVAAKQAVPFEDEYNQGQLSQHILKLTKPETPEKNKNYVDVINKKCLIEKRHGRVARKRKKSSVPIYKAGYLTIVSIIRISEYMIN